MSINGTLKTLRVTFYRRVACRTETGRSSAFPSPTTGVIHHSVCKLCGNCNGLSDHLAHGVGMGPLVPPRLPGLVGVDENC